jgi:hypothetical protein
VYEQVAVWVITCIEAEVPEWTIVIVPGSSKYPFALAGLQFE